MTERTGSAAWYAGYLLATVLLLGPLVVDPVRRIPAGEGSGDAFQFLWNLWWVKAALLEGRGSLWHTPLQFWPDGASLAWHSLSPANGLLSLPIQVLVPGPTGLVLASNLLVALSFVLSGGFARRLALLHGAPAAGAGLAGLLAVVLPYRAAHLHHLNLLSTWAGLATLVTWTLALRSGRRRDALAATVATAFMGWADPECAVATALVLPLVVLEAVRGAGLGATLRRAAAPALGAGLLLLPPVLAMARAPATQVPPASQALRYSADLLGLGLPGASSLLHQGWGVPLLQGATGLVGQEMYLGTLFLLVLGLLAVLPVNRGRRRVLLPGIALLLLALGPALHVGAHTVLEGWMPLCGLQALVPPLAMSRCPARFIGMAGPLLGVGLGILLPPPGRWRPLLLGLGALLVLERWPARPVPTVPAFVPEAVRALAVDPDGGPLLALPTPYFHRQVYLFWQTVHQRPLTTGYVARPPVEPPTVETLLATAPDEATAREALRALGVRKVLVHSVNETLLLQEEPRVVDLVTGPHVPVGP